MKRVGPRRYVHRSALAQLPRRDQARVAALARLVPDFAWSVARVGPDVMLGVTTSWEHNDHPALVASITRRGDALHARTYAGEARPIYHRCETMLDANHPRYAHFARLSDREQAAGKLSRPDVGTVGAWARVNPDPVVRARLRATFHRDGTVSHYSYSDAGWNRTQLLALTWVDIDDMPEPDQKRARALRATGRVNPATGDCYQAAANYVQRHMGEGLVLVHGRVTGTGGATRGKRFGHAWVLDTGTDTVIDVANGRHLRVPRAVYYAIGQAASTTSYTEEQLLVKLLRHKHFGPWPKARKGGR